MPEDNPLAKKAQEWFSKADHDLQTVEILFTDPKPPTDTLCFHCQQAVEKYLKGMLVLNNIDFMKTHDLIYLLKLAQKVIPDIKDYEEECLSLNKYSIEPRYPADIPIYYPIEEGKKAFKQAKELIKFIKKNAPLD